MSIEEVETLEECVLVIDSDKIKLPKKVKLSLNSVDDDYTYISLGGRQILRPGSYNHYESMEDYLQIKSAMVNGNYRLEFDEELNLHLEIL